MNFFKMDEKEKEEIKRKHLEAIQKEKEKAENLKKGLVAPKEIK